MDDLKMKKKILNLSLKKQWYEMIESGVKTEEYRELKPYWCNRLLYAVPLGIKDYWESVLQKAHKFCVKNPFVTLNKTLIGEYGTRGYTHVKFSYGYTKRTMTFELENISIGKGNKDWGAPDEDVFIIKLGKRIE